jgi:hypothetical protein
MILVRFFAPGTPLLARYSDFVNVNLLIDNIVRQTTLLVAQLATAAGVRTPLAHVAGQVFLDLVRELKAQGLGNKVIAEMVGLSLRTYHDRVRRLSESATDRGISLWEAVLNHVRSQGAVTRAAVLKRFHADDQASVRAVLPNSVQTGLLFRSGRADTTTFRAVSAEELAATGGDPNLAAAHWVWVSLHSQGSAGLSELAGRLGLDEDRVHDALASLEQDHHVAYDATAQAHRAEERVLVRPQKHARVKPALSALKQRD